MTGLDYAFVAVLALSIAWGVWRGLVREVISLAGWIAAFLVANLLAEPLANALPISNPDLRMIVAFVAIFVVTLTLAPVVTLPILPRSGTVAIVLPNDQVLLGGGAPASSQLELFTPDPPAL